MKKTYTFLFFLFFAIFGVQNLYAQIDNCGASATTLTSGTTCSVTTGNNYSPTILTTGSYGCNIGTTGRFRDGWFKFTAVQTIHTVTVDGANNFRPVVGVYTDCSAATTVSGGACASAGATGGIATLNLTGLTIGSTYFVQVYNFTADAGTQNSRNAYDICVTHPATSDVCATATTLTPNISCSYTAGDNEALTTGSYGCNTGTTGRFRDAWYRFVATQSTHNVTVDGSTNFQAVIGVFTDCSAGTNVTGGSCQTAGAVDGVITASLSGLTAGVTYYVQVYNSTGSTNTTNNHHRYDICVTTPTPPPANDVCASPTVLTHQAAGSCSTTAGTLAGATQSLVGCAGTADDDVWYSFVATSTVADIRLASNTIDEVVEVFSGTCAGLTSLICQDTPEGSVVVSGLTVGNTYLVRVYSWSSTAPSSPTFTICITSIAVPTNDACASPIVLTHQTFGNCTTTSATVANATQSLAGCTGDANDDVWFSFVATGTSADIRVNGSLDEVVQVFSGTCAGLSSLICQDSPEGNVVVNSLTVGATYLVRVYDYFASVPSNPSFTICVTNPNPPAITNDACTGAISLTHQAAGSCSSQTFYVSNATESQTYCSGTPSPVRDAWYRFTATSTSAIIHRIAEFRNVIQVFNGGASPGACGGASLDCHNPTQTNGENGQQGDLQVNGLTVGNVYFFRIYPTSNSTSNSSAYSLCITSPATVVNTTCAAAAPACSSTTITFQARTDGTAPAGNDYGCLDTQPSPTWFYLRIGNPGDLVFTLGASADIDYALWGPYNDLSSATSACGSLPAPVSCSYATDKIETVTITGAVTGRVYLLLVTNYAVVNQIIDIRQTGGTGTSDCSVLLASELQNLQARKQGNNNVIEWELDSKAENVKGFFVQKSTNGREFVNTRYVERSQEKRYFFSEQQADCKTAYYRVATIYQNGTQKTSNTLPIHRSKGDCENLVQVFPNPAQKKLYLIATDNAQSLDFVLSDLKGKTYLQGKTSHEDANQSIDIAQLPKGLYMLKVRIGNQWIYEKIVKE